MRGKSRGSSYRAHQDHSPTQATQAAQKKITDAFYFFHAWRRKTDNRWSALKLIIIHSSASYSTKHRAFYCLHVGGERCTRANNHDGWGGGVDLPLPPLPNRFPWPQNRPKLLPLLVVLAAWNSLPALSLPSPAPPAHTKMLLKVVGDPIFWARQGRIWLQYGGRGPNSAGMLFFQSKKKKCRYMPAQYTGTIQGTGTIGTRDTKIILAVPSDSPALYVPAQYTSTIQGTGKRREFQPCQVNSPAP